VKIPRSWINRLVEVAFEDHVENSKSGLPLIEARGRLTSIGRKYIRILAWECVNDPDIANGTTSFQIIKSTIETINLLDVVDCVHQNNDKV